MTILKNSVFLSRPFWIFFGIFLFFFIPMKIGRSFLGIKDGLMITLVSTQKSLPPNISAGSVLQSNLVHNKELFGQCRICTYIKSTHHDKHILYKSHHWPGLDSNQNHQIYKQHCWFCHYKNHLQLTHFVPHWVLFCIHIENNVL